MPQASSFWVACSLPTQIPFHVSSTMHDFVSMLVAVEAEFVTPPVFPTWVCDGNPLDALQSMVPNIFQVRYSSSPHEMHDVFIVLNYGHLEFFLVIFWVNHLV